MDRPRSDAASVPVTRRILLPHPAMLALLAACAAAPEPEPAPEPEAAAPEAAAVEYGRFAAAELALAIRAELAALRGDPGGAARGALELALRTRDLGVLRRAIHFASAAGDADVLLAAGRLWLELEPDSARPRLFLGARFAEAGDLERALTHLGAAFEMGAEVDFAGLASRAGRMDPAGRDRLIERFEELALRSGGDPDLGLGLVRLLGQNGRFDEALDAFDALRGELAPGPALVRLEASLLEDAGRSGEAIETLREGVEQFGDDRDLALRLARLLLGAGEREEARARFHALLERDPRDGEMLLFIAMLEMDLENHEAAVEAFTRLLAFDEHADRSRLMLGAALERLEREDEALGHYREVRAGAREFMAAQQRATRLAIRLGRADEAHAHLARLARGRPRLEIPFATMESALLVQAGHPERAKALLDRTLNRYPNETELLFARVLYHDSVDDAAASERDLRRIIRMLPEDARALNHLGYLLTERTTRHEEALELIERAIAVSPDDPAIIDSLGWVQYKLGRHEEALANLERAYALFPDHEVASHVGEVLWMMGRREDAARVWREALEARPDSELLRAVIERFRPEG